MCQSNTATPKLPTLIIVMGVSGSGKSSVAEALAKHYQLQYLDADDFHSEQAKAQMAAGIPLTDELRAPWVHNISAYLTECANKNIGCTLAFSGLRKAHRDALRELPFHTLIVHLEGSKNLIASRMNARSDHFMPTSLLDSQFASLEPCAGEDDILSIDITPPLPEVIQQCCQSLDRRLN